MKLSITLTFLSPTETQQTQIATDTCPTAGLCRALPGMTSFKPLMRLGSSEEKELMFNGELQPETLLTRSSLKKLNLR